VVLDVIQRQVEFERVRLGSAQLAPVVGPDLFELELVRSVERQHVVV
jgi:hypothetical protein